VRDAARSLGDKVEVHRFSLPLMIKAIALLRHAERGIEKKPRCAPTAKRTRA
jgi:hypothetical protein